MQHAPKVEAGRDWRTRAAQEQLRDEVVMRNKALGHNESRAV
jgi:hypothetical protein